MGWYDYDDFDYNEPSEPDRIPGSIFVHGPIRAVSKRGDIGVEWWGRQWVIAVDRVIGDGRLERGKRYARNGSVLDMEIAHGQAFAHVQGSRSRPYHTYVSLKPFTDEEWDLAIRALSEQAIYAAKLLAGEMPENIEAIFDGMGSSLFPRNHKDIQFDCSCPDWGDPCKHGAAVYYLLAEQIDADPFTLFHLRGRSREKVLSQLRAFRGVSEDESAPETSVEIALTPPLDSDLSNFWAAPDVNLVRSMPARDDKPFAFRQLGEPPMGAKDELGKIYKAIAEEAAKWLGLEE
jgi:uncharacterized Zn finger protein